MMFRSQHKVACSGGLNNVKPVLWVKLATECLVVDKVIIVEIYTVCLLVVVIRWIIGMVHLIPVPFRVFFTHGAPRRYRVNSPVDENAKFCVCYPVRGNVRC